MKCNLILHFTLFIIRNWIFVFVLFLNIQKYTFPAEIYVVKSMLDSFNRIEYDVKVKKKSLQLTPSR